MAVFMLPRLKTQLLLLSLQGWTPQQPQSNLLLRSEESWRVTGVLSKGDGFHGQQQNRRDIFTSKKPRQSGSGDIGLYCEFEFEGWLQGPGNNPEGDWFLEVRCSLRVSFASFT